VLFAAADSQRRTHVLPEPSAPWSSDNCTVVTAAAGATATFSVWTEERDLSVQSPQYQTGYLAQFTHFPVPSCIQMMGHSEPGRSLQELNLTLAFLR